MSRFAQATAVSVEKSEAEIKTLLRRYGADGYVSGWDHNRAQVIFRRRGLGVRFVLTLPDPKDRRFTHTASRGTPRSEADALAAWEQECRRAWRSLALVIKAKLEAVETGISTFESEFMAHIVLENGQTMGERFIPQIESMAKTGRPVQLLLTAGGSA